MIRLTYGKNHYHLQKEMVDWAEKQFGPGRWYKYTTGPNIKDNDVTWEIDTFAGMTWFTFQIESDAMLFMLKWPGCR